MIYLISAIILLGTGVQSSLLKTMIQCFIDNGLDEMIGNKRNEWEAVADGLRHNMVTLIAERDHFNYMAKHELAVLFKQIPALIEMMRNHQDESSPYNDRISQLQQVQIDLGTEISKIYEEAPDGDPDLKMFGDFKDMKFKDVYAIYTQMLAEANFTMTSDLETSYERCSKPYYHDLGNELSLAIEVQMRRNPDDKYLPKLLTAVQTAFKKLDDILPQVN